MEHGSALFISRNRKKCFLLDANFDLFFPLSMFVERKHEQIDRYKLILSSSLLWPVMVTVVRLHKVRIKNMILPLSPFPENYNPRNIFFSVHFGACFVKGSSAKL